MKSISLFTIGFVLGLTSTAGFAAEMSVVQMSPDQALFIDKAPADNELLFSFDLKSSKDWEAEVSEKAALFPGFKSFETWNVGDNTNETVIYKSQSVFKIAKSISQINTNRLTTVEFLNTIDPGFKHDEVSAQAINDAYAAEVKAGYESAKSVLDMRLQRRAITTSDYEQQMGAINDQLNKNLAQNWCQGSEVCIKSQTLPFSTTLKAFIGLANVAGQSFPDYLESYSTLSEVDKTSLPGNPDFGFAQTAVVSNKTIVSMKNLILFKEVSPSETIVTIDVTIVFEKDDLDKIPFNGAYDFLIGNSFLTSDEGLEMGLPALNQKLALDLKAAL